MPGIHENLQKLKRLAMPHFAVDTSKCPLGKLPYVQGKVGGRNVVMGLAFSAVFPEQENPGVYIGVSSTFASGVRFAGLGADFQIVCRQAGERAWVKIDDGQAWVSEPNFYGQYLQAHSHQIKHLLGETAAALLVCSAKDGGFGPRLAGVYAYLLDEPELPDRVDVVIPRLLELVNILESSQS